MMEIDKHLKSNDIKPSYQRIRIYEYLINKKNHPTVDNIYKELQQEIPTLSKTTVYNTLNLFVEKKIVQLIGIEENEMRYDADISTHAHFKCKDCEEVFDVFFNLSEIPIKELEGFDVEEEHLYFKGICKKCTTNKTVN